MQLNHNYSRIRQIQNDLNLNQKQLKCRKIWCWPDDLSAPNGLDPNYMDSSKGKILHNISSYAQKWLAQPLKSKKQKPLHCLNQWKLTIWWTFLNFLNFTMVKKTVPKLRKDNFQTWKCLRICGGKLIFHASFLGHSRPISLSGANKCTQDKDLSHSFPKSREKGRWLLSLQLT